MDKMDKQLKSGNTVALLVGAGLLLALILIWLFV